MTDAYKSASYHHWNKYHNPDPETAFMGGEYYLGVLCVNCEFSRATKIEIEKALAEARGG